MVLVVDRSGSICDTDPTFTAGDTTCKNWQLVVGFLEGLVDILQVGTKARVGLVLFSDNAQVEFTLDK